jgi:hypothetical protein
MENESTPSSEEFQTFENFSEDEISDGDSSEGAEDDWARPDESKESKEEKVKDDLKVLKDSKTDDKGKVIKEDKSDDSEDESEEEEDSEEDSDEEEEEKEKESEEDEEKSEEDKEKEEKAKKDSKKLRMRMGNELFNVDSEATFKVKVDGELMEVPVQELINNYSGKTAWDKKFTEIGKEKKVLETEKAQILSQKQELSEHVKKAIAPLKDKDANPLDSLMYLVEISGEDPYTAYRRIMEANLEEISTLMDMTETERELHFHKKKDELHSSIARKRQEAQQKEQTFKQVVQKVDQLRQSFNVSEDDFVDASEELERIYTEAKLDVNNITEEAIVDYASLRPHIATVKELIAPYEDNLSEQKYGDVVATLSRYLRDGKTDVAAVKEILKRNYSVEEDVKELNTKVYQKQGAKPKSKVSKDSEPSGLESFDDWD